MKKAVFIGLGGTGVRTITQLKEIFHNKLGKVPPMIKLLAFDTDDAFKLKKEENTYVLENETEFYKCAVAQPLSAIRQQAHISSVFPKKNVDMLGPAITNGAGQIRSIGRLAVMESNNNAKIRAMVNAALAGVHSINAHLSTDSTSTAPIEVFIICSLAGGTGSGMIPDFPVFIAEWARMQGINCKTRAIFVMPGLFSSIPFKTYIWANAYATLMEVDFLRDNMNVINSINYGNNTAINTRDLPYLTEGIAIIDQFKQINSGSLLFYNSSDIAENMIANALFTLSGELATVNNMIWDNVSKALVGETHKEKKSAYSGFGFAETTLNLKTLVKLYANRVAKQIIHDLQLTAPQQVDYYSILTDWGIREDRQNNMNQVIDAILPVTLPGVLPDPAPEDYTKGFSDKIQSLRQNYIEIIKQNSARLADNNLESFSTQKRAIIENFITERLNKEGGLSMLKDLLMQLIGYIDACKRELQEENTSLNGSNYMGYEQRILRLPVNEIIDRARNIESKLIGKKKKLQEVFDEFKNVVTQEAICHIEIIRRSRAIDFYSKLRVYMDDTIDSIMALDKKLANLTTYISGEEKKQSDILTRDYPFGISLGALFIDNELSKPGDNHYLEAFNDYFVSNGQDTETSSHWREMSIDQIAGSIEHFVSESKTIGQEIKNLDIEQAFLRITDAERTTLLETLRTKSEVMWNPIRSHGIPTTKYYLLGVPDATESFLLNKTNSNTGNEYLSIFRTTVAANLSSTGDKDRITVVCIEAALPVFAISGNLAYMKDEYNNPNLKLSTHTDDGWAKTMKEKGFDIMPMDQNEEIMETWVLGLVFGFIKKGGVRGSYKFKSSTRGLATDEYFHDSGIRDRVDAFDYFCKDIALRSDVQSFCGEKWRTIGDEAAKSALYSFITDGFLESTGLKKEVFEDQQHNEIRLLVNREIEFLKKAYDL